MSQHRTTTLWQVYLNFKYLFNIYSYNSNSSELFNKFIEYTNQIFRTKWNYFDNTDGMLVDDFMVSLDCEDTNCMEDGNDKYYTFQAIDRRIYFMLYIGERISPKCGYIDDYPEEIIPYFLQILKLFFPSIKFTQKLGVIQIWDLNTEHNDFIQYLFLIMRNIQNPEFNFEIYRNSVVPDRKDNEFSTKTKKLIRENANHCCESCDEQLLKPDYCKKSVEKYIQYSKYSSKDHKIYGYIDHINEHRFGGTKDAENGQLLCHNCHTKKTNMFSKSKIFYQKIKNRFSCISLKSSIKKITKNLKK
jgi:hypothetical protein